MLFRGKKKPEPLPRELWLHSGDFRPEEALPGLRGFYALPGGDGAVTDRFCRETHWVPFLAILRHALAQLSAGHPVALRVTECLPPGQPCWQERCAALFRRALARCCRHQTGHCGPIREDLFFFPALPETLYADFQRELDDKAQFDEGIGLCCCVLKGDPAHGPFAPERDVLMALYLDRVHPVLVVQLSPDGSLAALQEALDAACRREHWHLCRERE